MYTKAIDAAWTAHGATLAQGSVGELFGKQVKSAVKLTTSLSVRDLTSLKQYVPYEFLPTATSTKTHDHAVLDAMRELVRNDCHSMLVSHSDQSMVFVGSTENDISQYYHWKNSRFYVANNECKDGSRLPVHIFSRLLNNLKTKSHKKLRAKESKGQSALARFRDLKTLIHTWERTEKFPNDKVKFDFSECTGNILVFRDSIYNLSAKDICAWFRQTGAIEAVGYGCFPLELIFEDMPPSQLYRYRTSGAMSYMTYANGHCNGYAHLTCNWRTILASPIITDGVVWLSAEITSRVGPMLSFRLTRTNVRNVVPRTIGLRDCERYVRLLDLFESTWQSGAAKHKLVYFSINREVFEDIYQYLCSVREDSMVWENVMTFARRRCQGVSLISKELMTPWPVRKRELPKICLVALLHACVVDARANKVLRTHKPISGSGFSAIFKTLCGFVNHTLIQPIEGFLEMLSQHSLLSKLVLETDDEVFQVAESRLGEEIHTLGVLDFPEWEAIDEVGTDCPTCWDLHGRLGSQILSCRWKSKSEHTWTLGKDDCVRLRVKLLEDRDKAPGPLANVLDKARDAIVEKDIEVTTEVEYLAAGPGCGKSHLVRLLASTDDLILGPFCRLKADYTSVEVEGVVKTWKSFFTQHHAIFNSGAHSTIWVDEFTNYDYDLLAIVVDKVRPQKVVFVGDDKQTRLKDRSEGVYIGDRVDLSTCTRHELLCNFRCPKDVVAILNREFGYRMKAMSEVERSIEFVSFEDGYVCPTDALQVSFSNLTKFATDSEYSTRQVQGATVPHTVLFCLEADKGLAAKWPFQIVALSRHTKKLTIVHDGTCQEFFSKLHVTDEEIRATTADPDLGECCDHGDEELPVFQSCGGQHPPDLTGLFDRAWAENSVPSHKMTTPIVQWPVRSRAEAKDVCVQGHSVTVFPNSMGIPFSCSNGMVSNGTQTDPPVRECKASSSTGTADFSACCSFRERAVGTMGPVPDEVVLSSMRSVATQGRKVVVEKPKFVPCEKSTSGSVDFGTQTEFCEEIAHREPTMAAFMEKAFKRQHKTSALKVVGKEDTCLELSCLQTKKTWVVQQLKVASPIVRRACRVMPAERVVETLNELYDTHRGDWEAVLDDCVDLYLSERKKCTKVPPPPVVNRSTTIPIYSQKKVVLEGPPDRDMVFTSFCRDREFRWTPSTTHIETHMQHADFGYQLLVSTFFSPVVESCVTGDFPGSEVVVERSVHPPSDAFLLYDTLLPSAASYDECTSLNWAESQLVTPDWRGGLLKEDFFNGINQRFHPETHVENYFAFGPSVGNHFSNNLKLQVLSVCGTRYMGKIPTFHLGHTQIGLAHAIVDKWFQHCMQTKPGLNLLEGNAIFDKFLSDAVKRNYEEKFLGTDGLDTTSVRTVWFHLKNIFKPKVGDNFDPNKVGQGISAWDPTAQAIFCGVFRILGDFARSCEKPNVFTDNGIADYDFLQMVSSRVQEIPLGVNATTDGVMFDSQQNEFTQLLERLFWSRLGVSSEFLDYYYSFRHDYTINVRNFSGVVKWAKTSGEPATKENNGIVSKLISFWCLDHSGDFCIVYKGDDYFIRAGNLVINDMRVAQVEAACPLRLRIVLGDAAEFCGYAAVENLTVPSILRRLAKVVGHRHRDYEHWAEYQISIRDFCVLVRKIGVQTVVAANASLYNTTFREMENCFFCLDSFGHINKSQWRATVRRFSEGDLIPYATDQGNVVFKLG